MEHRKVLIDTSVIIDHLRKRDKQKSVLYKSIKEMTQEKMMVLRSQG